MNYILAWQSVLYCKDTCVIAKVVGSEMGGKNYNELVSEEVKCVVRDFCGEFPANKAVFMVMPANGGFSRLFLFPFYTFLLNYSFMRNRSMCKLIRLLLKKTLYKKYCTTDPCDNRIP